MKMKGREQFYVLQIFNYRKEWLDYGKYKDLDYTKKLKSGFEAESGKEKYRIVMRTDIVVL